jgi:glycerol-3-phosphate acyltransferase PlsY
MNALTTPVWLWQMPALALFIGYFMGSVPFGLLLARFGGAGDLREIGSGNIGATNVLRTGRKGLAAATLLLDLAKGAAAVLVGEWLLPGGGPMAGAAAIIGHCYPLWLRFAGGKGVATMMGVALALHWPVGLVFAAVWALALALSRRSSVGGMGAAASAPVAAFLLARIDLVPVLLALALMVLWRHRTNVARLVAGTEPKIGRKTSA